MFVWALAALAGCSSANDPEQASSDSSDSDLRGRRRDSGTSGGDAAGGSTDSGGQTDSGQAQPDSGQGHPDSGQGQPDSGQGIDSGTCVDSCPAQNGGVTVGCEKRFLYGVNYAWRNWGADFGGIQAWNSPGVSGNRAAVLADLQDMRSHGVDVVRWWMFEAMYDGVEFDANGNPTGLGGTTVADIQAALDLAAQAGVHYNFTLFSFDDFDPSATSGGATRHGINPIVTNAAKVNLLEANVVAQVAQIVAASPHADRVASWDVINEPEWAITDSDPYDNQAFGCNTGLECVTFAQMETFVKATATTLHAHSTAPITVGNSAPKWARAWSHTGIDYYTFHYYDWVNQYFPYTTPPSGYGVTGVPVVIGEFPLAGLTGVSYATFVNGIFNEGYAGATAWAVTDNCCGNWSTAETDVAAFAAANSCVTRY
jgi:hypothetical protein